MQPAPSLGLGFGVLLEGPGRGLDEENEIGPVRREEKKGKKKKGQFREKDRVSQGHTKKNDLNCG